MMPVKTYLSIGVFYFVAAATVHAQQTNTAAQPLDKKQHSLIVIAALAGKGDTKNLHTAFNEGLDAGWTINELKEVAVHIYAYAGFPRSLNALSTLQTVVKERKDKGIKDELGREPNPLPANKTKLELGTELQAKLLGRTMKTSTADFAPIIDIFLKEHLFGDIFGRDNLDFKTREFITISTLAGLGGAENQLRSHINVGMYNGITKEQLNHLVRVITSNVGAKEGNDANAVLQSIVRPGERAAQDQNAGRSITDQQ